MVKTNTYKNSLYAICRNSLFVYFKNSIPPPGITYLTRKIFLLSAFLFGVINMSLSQVNVLMHHNNMERNGVNNRETQLNPGNVKQSTFGKIGSYAVDDQVYAQPLIFTDVEIVNKGKKNILIVCTVNNSVYAFDADAPGTSPLWHVNFNGPGIVPPRNRDMNGACGGQYNDFSGNIGIVSTPAIDSATYTMYCLSRTKEFNTTFAQRLHALRLFDGSERPNSPVLIQASYPGNGDGAINGMLYFDPWKHNQRAALTIFKGNVYIAWASHCDWGPYHGWVLGYDIHTLAQNIVFNTTPQGAAGGIWLAGAGFTSDGNHLYVTTGNGTIGTSSNLRDPINRGESSLKLTPVGNTLHVDSWFTPFDHEELEELDQDLGSSGPVLIAGTNLMAFGGKGGRMYVVDKDNMGGLNTQANDNQIVQSFDVAEHHHIHGTPVFWRGDNGQYIYVWSEHDFLKMYAFDPAIGKFNPTPFKMSLFPVPDGMPGAMLSLSSNSNLPNTGILWASHPLSGDANHATRPGILRAFDANDVSKELWNSEDDPGKGSTSNFAKFNCPTIANGKVYLATFSNKIDVFGGRTEIPTDTISPSTLTQGLDYKYYEGTYERIPDFNNLFPIKKGQVSNVDISNFNRPDNYAFSFNGFIKISQPGMYKFYLSSDDGSNLYINDTLLVDNDERHPLLEKSDSIFLKAGLYPLSIGFFEASGGQQLLLKYSGPGFSKQSVPDSVLYRKLPEVEKPEDALGVNYSYYNGRYDSIPDFSTIPPTKTGESVDFSLEPRDAEDFFAFQFKGYLKITTPGNYTFFTSSDDGSTFSIKGNMVVNNDGPHAEEEKSGSINLAAGYHPYTLNYFESYGENSLSLMYQGPGILKQTVPLNILYKHIPANDSIPSDSTIFLPHGIHYSYYEGFWSTIPNFMGLMPVKTGHVPNFDIRPALRQDDFAFHFNGMINVPTSGMYTFFTSSDDGSNLYIDNFKVVDNDGYHGMVEESGSIFLTKGLHAISVNYFQHAGGRNLVVTYQGPGIPKQVIPESQLYRMENFFKRVAIEENNQATFSYAPNPTDGLLNIQYTAPEGGELVVQLMNQMSAVVMEKQVKVSQGSNLITLNLAEINGGIYQLFCIGTQKKFTGKIVLVK